MRVKGPWGWILVVSLAVVPVAWAESDQDPIQLDVEASTLRMAPPCLLEAKWALWRAGSLPGDGTRPAIAFLPETTTAIQYWRNRTLVVDPRTGTGLWAHMDPLASRTLTFRPEEVYLVRPRDGPDLRLAVDAESTPESFQAAPGLTLSVEDQATDLVPPRASFHLGSLYRDLSERRTSSGWSELTLRGLEGTGDVTILVDGWELRLSNPSNTANIQTGTTMLHDLHGVHHQSYSFLVLTSRASSVEFPSANIAWRGYVADPGLQWSGAAYLNQVNGFLSLDGITHAIQSDVLKLEGEFHAWTDFAESPADAQVNLRATGRGSTSYAPPAPTSSQSLVSLPAAIGLGAPMLLGLLLIGAFSMRSVRVSGAAPRRSATPRIVPRASPAVSRAHHDGPVSVPIDPLSSSTAPVPDGSVPHNATATGFLHDVEGMLAKVRDEPLNGEARFHLGVALLKAERSREGLRHLAQSFRLSPESLLRFLESPDYEDVRRRHEVRALLGRIQREQHWKIWGGYA